MEFFFENNPRIWIRIWSYVTVWHWECAQQTLWPILRGEKYETLDETQFQCLYKMNVNCHDNLMFSWNSIFNQPKTADQSKIPDEYNKNQEYLKLTKFILFHCSLMCAFCLMFLSSTKIVICSLFVHLFVTRQILTKSSHETLLWISKEL